MKPLKRAQVTMFIIVALVIIIVFVALFFIMGGTQEQRLKVSKDQLKMLLTKESKYHTYITSCLDQATKNALWTLGYQGGVIYTTQANNTKPFLRNEEGHLYVPFHVTTPVGEDVVYNISYGIVRPRLGVAFHPEAPLYPYPGKLTSSPQDYNPAYSSTLGNFPQPSPFTPLCDSRGLNAPFMPNASYSCGSYETSYDSGNVWDHNSIQEYLEEYIREKVMHCIVLEDLPELVDWNITYGDAQVIAAFSDDFVFSFLNYTLQLQRGAQQEVLRLETYSTKVPVRLRQIHELLHRIIKEDTNNIFFDSIRDAPTLDRCTNIGSTQCLKQGMRITKARDVCPACSEGHHDDVLIIQDDGSVIDGIPYQFHVAAQNRIPSLDVVENNVSFILPDGRRVFLVFPHQELRIDPRAYDPDEDNHGLGFMDKTYAYDGWRETYFETFAVARWQTECLDATQCYARLGEYSTPVYVLPNKVPRSFSRSALFNAAHRSAAFVVNTTDYGLHNVTVSIYDDGNLRDWQTILVYVPPAGEIMSSHPYGDIPYGVTSIEDEITLHASLTEEQQNDGYAFSWNVGGETPNGRSQITIGPPSQQLFTSPLQSGEKMVSLVITDSSGTQIPPQHKTTKIYVAPCLPHRSVVSPYPFNNFILEKAKEPNKLLANHPCCLGNPEDAPSTWQIAPPGTPCYEKTFEGTYDEVDEQLPFITTPLTGDTRDPVNPQKRYTRTIQAVCTGNSGYECTDVTLNEMKALS